MPVFETQMHLIAKLIINKPINVLFLEAVNLILFFDFQKTKKPKLPKNNAVKWVFFESLFVGTG